LGTCGGNEAWAALGEDDANASKGGLDKLG
jgi:hypothetical protein